MSSTIPAVKPASAKDSSSVLMVANSTSSQTFLIDVNRLFPCDVWVVVDATMYENRSKRGVAARDPDDNWFEAEADNHR